MVAFKGGNNTGGQEVRYYDNPNYDPKNEGKSKGDKALRKAAAEQNYSDRIEADYYEGRSDDYQNLVQSEVDAKYAQSKADLAKEATVSYFRGRERERLNPGGVGGPQINPRFSKPVSFEDKLSRIGPGYDDWLDDQVDTARIENTFDDMYGGDSEPSDYPKRFPVNENSVKIKGGSDGPMPKTVAGVNQELQAIKTRTRDAAMKFRGMVFDYIDDIKLKNFDYADAEVAEHFGKSDEYIEKRMPLTFKELEDKYFPDDASKKAAKAELKKMISFTDNASDVTRNYSNLSDYAETIARQDMPSLPFPVGIDDGGYEVDDKITAKNYRKNLDAYSKWKSKKGIPKIIRVITKLS